MAKTKPPQEPVPTPYLIGYARVSTDQRSLDLQLEALRKAGVKEDNLHIETLSATSKRRPALDNAIKDLRPGDTFIVWRLDRLARNMRDLLKRLEEIEDAGAKFRSLTESFDTALAGGRFMLYVLGAVAEFERQLIRERISAGMQVLKAKGVQLGAKRKMDEAMIERVRKLMLTTKLTNAEIAKKLGIAVSSIYGHFPGGRAAVVKAEARRRSKRRAS